MITIYVECDVPLVAVAELHVEVELERVDGNFVVFIIVEAISVPGPVVVDVALQPSKLLIGLLPRIRLTLNVRKLISKVLNRLSSKYLTPALSVVRVTNLGRAPPLLLEPPTQVLKINKGFFTKGNLARKAS